MTLLSIRKVYQGIADRRQMFRMFDRHAKRPSRFQDDATALYRGEWFRNQPRPGHDYMFEVLPPLWMAWRLCSPCANSSPATSPVVFFSLKIDGQFRYFHGYCDLSDRGSPAQMRDTIVERESRPVRAMTREERLEHIWSATHDQYRAYADWRYPGPQRGKRLVMNFAAGGHRDFDLLDQLTDAQIAGKLPVHLRYLPDAIAA